MSDASFYEEIHGTNRIPDTDVPPYRDPPAADPRMSVHESAREFDKKNNNAPVDMKAALGNASKPDHTHVRTAIMTYIARACEYGSAKYERANYMRPTPDGSVKSNFIRFGGYLRSVQTHIAATLDSMELHLATDPDLEDEAGMLSAAYAPDTDETQGAKVGASGLPHVAHAAAALMMATVQATLYGLLPSDPGQPWTPQVSTAAVTIPAVATRGPDVHTCMHSITVGCWCNSCQSYVRLPPT